MNDDRHIAAESQLSFHILQAVLRRRYSTGPIFTKILRDVEALMALLIY